MYAERNTEMSLLGSLFMILGENWFSEQIRFFLHDPRGDLCIFLDLLIDSSLFVMFHTS